MNIVRSIILSFLILFGATNFTLAEKISVPMKEVKKISSLIKKGKIDKRRLRIIYFILQHTTEVNIHQMGGENGNQVMLHKNGQYEVVLDKDDNRIEPGTMNAGSFNYYAYSEDPLMHFALDIDPWINWGNSPDKDKSTKKQRVNAYLDDALLGVERAYLNRKLLKNVKDKKWNDGEIRALSIYIYSEGVDSKDFIKLFEGEGDPYKIIPRVMDRFAENFKKLY